MENMQESLIDKIIQDYEMFNSTGEPKLPWMMGDSESSELESALSWKDRIRRFLGQTPVKKKKSWGEDIPWTRESVFGFFRFWENPIGFCWKLFSLSALPLFLAIIGYDFFYYLLDWSKTASLAVFIFFFLFSLRDSILTITARPLAIDVLRLLFHELALLWLMFIAGSFSYSILNNGYMNRENSETVGLIVGIITYFLALPNVCVRTGAATLFKYLIQVICVVFTNLLFTVIGYITAPFIYWFFLSGGSRPPYWNYAACMFFAFTSFWIAVNLFYVRTNYGAKKVKWGDEEDEMGIGIQKS